MRQMQNLSPHVDAPREVPSGKGINTVPVIEQTICSTNNAVVEVQSTVIYLVQYEYMDEPGSYWPDKSFTNKLKAEQYVNRINCTQAPRFYSVVPILLEGYAL